MFRPNTGKYGPEKTPYLDTFHTVIIDGINLIFTIPQGGIVKLKSSIENVLNLKPATPTHLLKIAGQFSCCGALRDLLLFVQFKKRQKHPCRSVTFSKVTFSTLLKVSLLYVCFSRFLNCALGTKSQNAPHMHLALGPRSNFF